MIFLNAQRFAAERSEKEIKPNISKRNNVKIGKDIESLFARVMIQAKSFRRDPESIHDLFCRQVVEKLMKNRSSLTLQR